MRRERRFQKNGGGHSDAPRGESQERDDSRICRSEGAPPCPDALSTGCQRTTAGLSPARGRCCRVGDVAGHCTRPAGGGPPAVSPIMPGGFREWLGHQRRRPDCTGQFARAIDRIERARGAPLGDLVGMRAVCHADHGETLPLMPDMTTADWRTWLLARRLLRPLSASE